MSKLLLKKLKDESKPNIMESFCNMNARRVMNKLKAAALFLKENELAAILITESWAKDSDFSKEAFPFPTRVGSDDRPGGNVRKPPC